MRFLYKFVAIPLRQNPFIFNSSHNSVILLPIAFYSRILYCSNWESQANHNVPNTSLLLYVSKCAKRILPFYCPPIYKLRLTSLFVLLEVNSGSYLVQKEFSFPDGLNYELHISRALPLHQIVENARKFLTSSFSKNGNKCDIQ